MDLVFAALAAVFWCAVWALVRGIAYLQAAGERR